MWAAQISSLIILLPIAILSPTIAANFPDPILYEIFPFIRVYKNGTVQRFIGQDIVPPSPSIPTPGGVLSKDVIYSQKFNLSARIYRPAADGSKKLPLLLYFHGGGFFAESAFSPSYDGHLNRLVAKAKVVAVSVNYRLAPEHPLPAAYQDSWLALNWFLSPSTADQWLTKYADLGRVYLGGDSAGANIAHHMAIRIGNENPGVKINGMFLNCPYFLGKRAIGNESGYPYLKTQMQKLWNYGYPNDKWGVDDPLVNPAMDRNLGRLGCGRVLVFVAGNDGLRFRGLYYAKALEKRGWKGVVKVVEFKGEDHVFNLGKPNSSDALRMLSLLDGFLNHGSK